MPTEEQQYNELLALYPEEQWVEETDDEEEFCATCTGGDICRVAIATDVDDIRAELRRLHRFPAPLQILTWLYDSGYNSLTHSICQLTDEFIAEQGETCPSMKPMSC